MTPVEPLPLHHSWPLFERARRFEHGSIEVEALLRRPIDPTADDGEALARQGIGLWECNLATGQLAWSSVVHDLFGLPRDLAPARERALAVYTDESRAAMERLRAYAIKHRRGFTIDVQLQPAGTTRWMRLIAAPLCEESTGNVTHLQGLKLAL